MNARVWFFVGLATCLTLAGSPLASALPPHDPEVTATAAHTFSVMSLPTDGEDLVFGEANSDGSVVHIGPEITLATDVFFAYNDATLNDRAHRELGVIVEKLRSASPRAVRVIGHTDSDGSEAANQLLSERRAESVRAVLAAGLSSPISAIGRGETEPVAPNDSDEGRAANRRVVITTEEG